MEGAHGWRAGVKGRRAAIAIAFRSHGLLETFTDARGHASTMTCDDMGRLQTDTRGDATIRLTPSGDGGSWEVTKTDPEQRETRYTLQKLETGETQRINTFPDGTQASSISTPEGSTTNLADGTSITVTKISDPRFGGVAATRRVTTELPIGSLERTVETVRTSTLGDPTTPLSLTAWEETVTVNGRPATTAYDPTTRVFTTTSPAGRIHWREIDELGHTVASGIGTRVAEQWESTLSNPPSASTTLVADSSS